MNEETIQWDQPSEQVVWDKQPASPPSPPTEGRTLGGFAGNIPKSGFEFGKNIVGAITSPIETVKNIAGLPRGLGHLIAEKMGANLTPEEKFYVDKVRALGEHVAERYGGWENIKKTAYEDPVGFAADISGLLSGMGGLLKAGGLTKAGEIASKVGQLTEPINVAKEAVGLGIKVIPRGSTFSPEGLYQSAVKMPKSEKWGVERRLKAAETGLEERVLPTVGGYERLWDKIITVADDVKSKVNELAQRGEVLQVDDILKATDDLRKKYMNKPTPQDYLGPLADFEEKFRLAHSTSRTGGIPVDKAYAIKQEVYTSWKNKYNSPIPPAVNPGMEMAIARGIRKEMAAKYPNEMFALEKEGRLLDLEEAIKGAVRRIPDRDLMGIGTPIKVAAGAATGHFNLGMLAALVDNPIVKSTIAIFLNEAKKAKISPIMTGARQGLFQAGRYGDLTPQMEE